MATRVEVDAYANAIDGLSAIAYAQIKALLQSLDNPNPIVFRDALLRTYPELMAPFISAAGDIAAQWYTTLRANAGVTVAYSPVVAALPDDGKLDALARYSLSPLFAPQEFIGSSILVLLAGASQKLIANQGRDTIMGAAVNDPVRVGYARIPQPGACAFCSLLASRGAVYRSAETANGKKYHNHCKCVAVPVFPGGDNALVAETEAKYSALYQEAVGTKLSDYSRRNPDAPQFQSTSLKETLANWRIINGVK